MVSNMKKVSDTFKTNRDNNLVYKSLKKKSNPWKNGKFKDHGFKQDMAKLEFDVGNEKSIGNEKWL